MIITAKFASMCPCCSSRIVEGSKVEWNRGEKARHVACAAAPGARIVASAPLRVTSTSRRARSFSYTPCEGWGSDNPHAPREGHCIECEAMG